MKFTGGEALMYLLTGFVLGLFLMALIQWLENEWGEIDAWLEKLKRRKK